MTPLASVAMLEKFALLKMAFCSAPVFRSASSACLRVLVFWRLRLLVPAPALSFPRVIVRPRDVICFCFLLDARSQNLRCKQRLHSVLKLSW